MDRSSTGRASSAAARMLTIASAALLVALVCAPAAWGIPLPLVGGETRLELNRGLQDALRREGVVLKPLGPAKLKGRHLTLPVGSGSFDREAEDATFGQSGGLRLVAGRKAVALRRLTFDASGKSLSANVAGKRMRLALLGGAKLEHEGFNTLLEVKRLPVTAAAAATLNRGLGLEKPLRAGRSFGSADGLGEPAAVEIAFGTIAIGGLDTTFSKLKSLGARIGIWGGSERWGQEIGDPYFLFPVKPTTLPPDASTGVLEGEADDGVTVQVYEESSPLRGDMLLRGPRVDLAAQELAATVSGLSGDGLATGTIATLDYGAATFQVRPRVGAFELMGIRAVATQFVADQLNARFGTPSFFQAGETLARVTLTLSDD